MTNTTCKYEFKGAVIDAYARVICAYWCGSTYAVSEAKAKSNLCFQFKRNAGLSAASRVRLDGTVSRA